MSADFFFDKTDLFNRVKRLETILGLNDNFSANDVDVRLNSIQQTLDTINANYTTRTYVDNRLIEKVNKVGDTLIGNLTLLDDPTENNHLITKEYADNILTQLGDLDITLRQVMTDQLANKVSKFGDILYGELVLSDDANNPLNPVSKQQFDTALNSVAITGNLDW